MLQVYLCYNKPSQNFIGNAQIHITHTTFAKMNYLTYM